MKHNRTNNNDRSGGLRLSALVLLLALAGLSAPAFARSMITVRLIKDTAMMAKVKPVLLFNSKQSAYALIGKTEYNVESLVEIRFELETEDSNLLAEALTVVVPGIRIKRVIIGRTDVPFQLNNDSCHFNLVADTLDGGHIQTAWQNPRGGPFMWIYHNSEERVAGEYKDKPYPAKALAAALNYEVACQELLRLMGDMDGLGQKFYGSFILLNCESSAPRGHMDFPPHWHLQHWEHGYDKEYGIAWRQRQYIIPHYYVDSSANILYNQQSLRQNDTIVRRPKKKFMPGDTCTWADSKGNLIFKQVIKDGLLFIRPDGVIWKLQPGTIAGYSGIWIYKGKEQQVFCRAEDDGMNGLLRLSYTYYRHGKKRDQFTDSIPYDPYTGLSSGPLTTTVVNNN